MSNQATSLIRGKDDNIDTTDNLNGIKEEITPPIVEISQRPHETKITMPWNWRLETDTAGLFLAMFG